MKRLYHIGNFFLVLFVLSVVIVSFAMTGEALACQDNSNSDTLITKYTRLLYENARDTEAIMGLAQKYLELDSLEHAKNYFMRALSVDENLKEAYNGLGLVEYRKGVNDFFSFTDAVKKLFKKDPFTNAIEYFNKALEIDKDYLEAYYNLGRTYYTRGSQEENEKALEIFKDIVLNNSTYKEAYFYLGKVYAAKADHYYTTLGDVEKGNEIYDEAIEIYKSVIKREPDNALPRLAIADIYINTERMEEAVPYYLSGIQLLKDEEELEYRYGNVKMLMTEEEQEEYHNTPLGKKGDYIAQFWKRKDINPVTAENERLLEHFKRLNHVRRSFSTKSNEQGYDDRGKIYLRYGPPEQIFKSIQESNTKLGYGSKPNESWVYPTIHDDLFFDFVNTNGREYKLVPNLRFAAPPGSRFDVGVLHELYSQRAHLGSVYAKMNNRNFEEIKDHIDYYAGERDALWSELPAETYFPDYNTEELPFAMDYAQFKGDNGKTKVMVYYSVPVSELNLKPEGGDVYATALNNQIVFTDSMNNRIAYRDKQNKIVSANKEEAEEQYIINDMVFFLAPDDYIFGIQLGDIYREKLSIVTIPFKIRDFTSPELQLSDLLFASDIRVDDNGKKSMELYPYSVVNKNIPLHLYFEIYNLSYNQAGRSIFTVEYTARNLKKEGGNIITAPFRKIKNMIVGGEKQSISLNFKREASLKDVEEFIEFNFKELDNGETEIAVKITDLNSGVLKEISKKITLVDK